jgi:NRAMP (natural resistance-associated macrophage protein)-like metal ion transporter
LLSVLFWSVISAAFIGPGTVTTAAAAGSGYGLDLLWSLVYATFACILLQEAAARITIASGYSLGEAIARQYAGSRSAGMIRTGLAGAVVFGCAAYQAGNILGAVTGLRMLLPVSPAAATVGIAAVCAVLLWLGNFRTLANFLGLVVGLMGVAFMGLAAQLPLSAGEVLAASVIPRFPEGSLLLVIGLIGTTIVPYNLFLASGIGQEQRLAEMRTGIGVAVAIGGLISVAILLVGTAVRGTFTYEALVAAITGIGGGWLVYLFGTGLFAAGFTSAITAPLAAAVTVQSLRRTARRDDARRDDAHRDWRYRLVWLGVLGVGFGFGIADVKPIPVIILAQGINGVLLPLVTVFLLLAVNDPGIVPAGYRNGPLANGLMLLLVGTTTLLGVTNLTKAAAAATGNDGTAGAGLIWYELAFSLAVAAFTGYLVRRRRQHKPASPAAGSHL